MKTWKKALAGVLAMGVCCSASVALTAAYLTDRDSEANVFTVGDVKIDLTEDFDQGSTLIPGVKLEKDVKIKNTGKNDAYVWAKIALPTVLDGGNDASKNVVHFNYTEEAVGAGQWTWWYEGTKNWMYDSSVDINGVKYNVYSVLYQTALKPGEETTTSAMFQAYLDYHIDIDPKGDWYHVEKGVVEGPYWNSGTDGAPIMYVSAYGIQTEGYADVNGDGDVDVYDAYATYKGQWADKGDEWVAPVTVATDDALKAAITDPDVKTILVDGELTYDWGGDSYESSKALLMKGKTFIGADVDSVITFAGYGSANPITDVVLENLTVKDETVGDNEASWEHGYLEFVNLTANNVVFADDIMLDGDCTLINCSANNEQASWYALWIEGGNVELKDCTFTGTRAVKIHEAYSTEVKSVVVDGCEFTLSEKPGIVIGELNADTSVTIKNSTFDTQAGDQSKYIYETDTDVATFNFSESGNTVK